MKRVYTILFIGFLSSFLCCSKPAPTISVIPPVKEHLYIHAYITVPDLLVAYQRAVNRDHIHGSGTVAIIEVGDSTTVFIAIKE